MSQQLHHLENALRWLRSAFQRIRREGVEGWWHIIPGKSLTRAQHRPCRNKQLSPTPPITRVLVSSSGAYRAYQWQQFNTNGFVLYMFDPFAAALLLDRAPRSPTSPLLHVWAPFTHQQVFGTHEKSLPITRMRCDNTIGEKELVMARDME